MSEKEKLPYRPCAGMMIMSSQGKIFIAQRMKVEKNYISESNIYNKAWQMPQGGIDEGENPIDAAIREIKEETSIPKENLTYMKKCNDILYYDLPEQWIGKLWHGKYRGQAQHWFLFRFDGDDSNIDIHHVKQPEFRQWRWADIDEILNVIVPFKYDVYKRVIAEFRDLVKPS